MSSAFVKEGDQEEVPIIPPRAALPPGVTNYVTPHGMAQLLEEQKQLEEEKSSLSLESEKEQRLALMVLNGRLLLLQERINSAVVLNPEDATRDEVRFGAKVTLRATDTNQVQQFQIVGVDEADVKNQKIAFIAPIARAVTGKKAGDVAHLNLGSKIRKLEILEVSW
ncbi:GreA/GreB family elongation factor [Telluribacter humicola]|uniref:GreA/GreB family elongation factor n=1 Tax=Telluribacter humicola TaxID=1720261 RepID=UPI001A971AAC|nr:GreA/GreB family elongation factor [Telluribacter humicola]